MTGWLQFLFGKIPKLQIIQIKLLKIKIARKKVIKEKRVGISGLWVKGAKWGTSV